MFALCLLDLFEGKKDTDAQAGAFVLAETLLMIRKALSAKKK